MDADVDLLALEREMPSLAGLKRFAASFEDVDWFSHLGEPLAPHERALARAYLDRLGFPDSEIAQLVDWEDAALSAETLDWNNPAWEAEELARTDLGLRALAHISEEGLQIGLTMIADAAGQAIRNAMNEAAALWDVSTEPLQNIAAGSAIQACHNAALSLVVAANDPDFEPSSHCFQAKFKLFEMGRWPVGIVGGSFNLF